MHVGHNYSLKEVLNWTRKDIYHLFLIAVIPVIIYQVLGWKWVALPWLPIALLGTAVAFVVGFKNNAAYDRLWEARKIWGAILNISRTWAIMTKDYITNTHAKEKLTKEELAKIHLEICRRHFAWVNALRFQLREPRAWEAVYKSHNQEYKDKYFVVEEHAQKVEEVLKKYLSPQELDLVMSKTNKAAQIIALQSTHLRELLDQGLIEDFRHMELERLLMECYTQQGASERIKNFPYPRHYATLNLYFIMIFVILVPFGMLQEFEKLGECMIWLSVPFSVLSGWIFTTMEKIGETSESPFEGSPNDVPITQISRNIEIDMLEILNINHELKPIKPHNNIVL